MFRDGDQVPIPRAPQWFETPEEAVATLFDEDEESSVDDCVQ